jgi:hypothetical protein
MPSAAASRGVPFRSRCLRIGPSVMSAPPRPSPPVLMDHQPYVALPDADTLDMRATDMYSRGEDEAALPLHQQVLVLAQTAHTPLPPPRKPPSMWCMPCGNWVPRNGYSATCPGPTLSCSKPWPSPSYRRWDPTIRVSRRS